MLSYFPLQRLALPQCCLQCVLPAPWRSAASSCLSPDRPGPTRPRSTLPRPVPGTASPDVYLQQVWIYIRGQPTKAYLSHERIEDTPLLTIREHIRACCTHTPRRVLSGRAGSAQYWRRVAPASPRRSRQVVNIDAAPHRTVRSVMGGNAAKCGRPGRATLSNARCLPTGIPLDWRIRLQIRDSRGARRPASLLPPSWVAGWGSYRA